MKTQAELENDDTLEWVTSLSENLTDEVRTAYAQLLEGAAVEIAPTPQGTELNKISAQLIKFYIDDGLAYTIGSPYRTALLRILNRKKKPVQIPKEKPKVEVSMNDEEVVKAIRSVYRATVQRLPSPDEIAIWQKNLSNNMPFHRFLNAMSDGAEGKQSAARERLLPDMNDASFIEHVYRRIEGRGALPNEIEHFRGFLSSNRITREKMLKNFFTAAVERETSEQNVELHDGLSCWVAGTGHLLTLEGWQEQAKNKKALKAARKGLVKKTPFTITPKDDKLRTSIITSLYCGGDYIEKFMDNIVSQTCFDKYTELLVIDADSPEGEAETIERYTKDHPNIRYKRMNSRIGIYEAWNLGVRMARGDYLTNANLDDLRRDDSFEIQAGTMDAMPFVDVVYQDYYYSFDPALSWDDVASFGHKSNLSIVTPYNILKFNSPHNAPMWRRSLHNEIGMFDESMKSAGDYDFWMRCIIAGKTFFKVNEPHVVYYQNPLGLSTRPDSTGIVEGHASMRKHTRSLISDNFRLPLETFAKDVVGLDDTEMPISPDRFSVAHSGLRALASKTKSVL